MEKRIEVREIKDNGVHQIEEAVAVIAIIPHDGSFVLHIRENGELPELFWEQLPDAMKQTVNKMLENRRKAGYTK